MVYMQFSSITFGPGLNKINDHFCQFDWPICIYIYMHWEASFFTKVGNSVLTSAVPPLEDDHKGFFCVRRRTRPCMLRGYLHRFPLDLPSGKHTYAKLPFSVGKSTTNWPFDSSKLLNYQRVAPCSPHFLIICWIFCCSLRPMRSPSTRFHVSGRSWNGARPGGIGYPLLSLA